MNLEACHHIERTLLGACLLEDEQTLDLVCSEVQPEHFSLDSHQRIARRIRAMYQAQKPVALPSVVHELAAHNELAAVGGAVYLSDLTTDVPTRLSTMAREYIDRLKEFWRRRELLKLSAALGDARDERNSHELVQMAASRMEAIVSETASEDSSVSSHVVAVLDQWHRERQATEFRGVTFGIPALDQGLGGGMREGQQTAVGAASGVGKTNLMAQALFSCGRQGIPAHAFLYEPTRAQVMRKLYALAAGVPARVATHPWTASSDETDRFQRAASVVAEWPLRIEDNPSLTLDHLLGIGRLSIHRYGTRLIATDYIQRMNIPPAETNEAIRLRIGRASTALVNMVKNTTCHSLLLSQITTGRKGGAQAMPTMFDFRESSQIENDAHNIVLLHREFDEQLGHYTSEGAIIVPKQRFGVPFNIPATFDARDAVWTSRQHNHHQHAA